MHESLFSAYAELLHGAAAGFDGICVTEHSQSAYDISPNPNLLAAAVAYATQAEGLDVAITVLGRSLGKTREPLKIAEEYALLDCVSGGRLIAGFPVGLSYDANLNAALPPVETRERYREHRELILKAWSEPRPFPWNGRFEKYGQVNIWPRPVSSRIRRSGFPGTGSPGTMRGHPRTRLRLRVPELGRPEARRAAGLRPLLGPRGGDGPRPQPVPARLPAGGRRLRDRRAGRDGLRRAPGTALPIGPRRDPATAIAVPGYAEPAAIEGMLRAAGHRGMLSRMKTATYAETRRQPGRDRGQPGHGRRPDRGVRARVPDRQPDGDAPERLDAARPDREEHLAVRRGGAAAAAADLGRRGLGEPLVATRARHDGAAGAAAEGQERWRRACRPDETVEVWTGG